MKNETGQFKITFILIFIGLASVIINNFMPSFKDSRTSLLSSASKGFVSEPMASLGLSIQDLTLPAWVANIIVVL